LEIECPTTADHLCAKVGCVCTGVKVTKRNTLSRGADARRLKVVEGPTRVCIIQSTTPVAKKDDTVEDRVARERVGDTAAELTPIVDREIISVVAGGAVVEQHRASARAILRSIAHALGVTRSLWTCDIKAWVDTDAYTRSTAPVIERGCKAIIALCSGWRLLVLWTRAIEARDRKVAR
jgi:hypothetical protein